MNLTLAPSLFNICNRSKAFRHRFRYDQLNVCNVVRSLVYVLLVKDVILPVLAFLVVNSVAQLVFVMVINGLWDPFKATDIIIEAVKAQNNFRWASPTDWVSGTSMILSCLAAMVGVVVVYGGSALLVLVGVGVGVSKLLKLRLHVEAVDTVLTPLNVGFEWLAARHNKFCVNVSAQVNTRTTYKDFLEAAHKEERMLHQGRLRNMSIAELAASVESTRAVLANYKL